MKPDFTGPYCLIHKDGKVTYASGSISQWWRLSDLPRPSGFPVISMTPYSQLRERGYLTHDGNEPIISLVADEYRETTLEEVVDFDLDVRLAEGPVFSLNDEEFAAGVAEVIDEIRRGQGSNFLYSRRCNAVIADFDQRVANVIFGRLARNEIGAYMTFCFHDGERYFIGASPESHLTYRGGTVAMNPICGTLPRAALHTREDLLAFLSDPKEINELFQVVDEELKMMSRICGKGGVVHGPYLKEMSSLVHTEYVLQGPATMDPVDAFRESMFAATMIGSPLENAARVIHRHEPESRRYYSSALVVMGLDEAGEEYLDSAITIRTMEVGASGEVEIRTGASIVRDSVPENECAEIRAKAHGLLNAISSPRRSGPWLEEFVDDGVRARLHARNERLSRFWIDQQRGQPIDAVLQGKSVLLVDNEDQFTLMLRHILEHLGLKTTVRDYREPVEPSGHDLILLGPGPGDPRDLSDPKMARLHDLVRTLTADATPFLAVCLSHQVLCDHLGMTVAAVDPPLQGVQQTIDLFGRSESVGFYNTFFAQTPQTPPPGVEISAEPDGRIIALRSPTFYSVQFHVESVLTTNCVEILREALHWLLR